jgi:hypothetical protein
MATNKILLLGAGFSHNWHAPLSREVANSLLQAVGNDARLQEVLKRYEKNFESALSEIQRDFISAPSSQEVKRRFDILQGAIAAMFERINSSFEPPAPFEFSNVLRYSVAHFLARFDAIFSLNQDLLLELRYAHQVPIASNMRFNGLEMPGMRPTPDAALTGIGDNYKRLWTPAKPPYSITIRFQPHFKLHGSSNWYTEDGRRLLVMGGDKDIMIKEHEVLRWYHDEFKRHLKMGRTKLMVIGYSFSDSHIDEAIVDAWQSGNLAGMFLVNPSGRDVLNPTPPHQIKVPRGVEYVDSLGGSTRPISATFAGDSFEHQKFIDFFRDGEA